MSFDDALKVDPVTDGKIRPALGDLLINTRVLLVVLFAALTIFFGYQTTKLRPDASFEKMIPISHSYIVNFLENRADLSGLGNSVRITVETTEGDIFTAEFQEMLRQITDEVFYIRGVDYLLYLHS